MANIAMFGTGYVGLVNGACLAHIGHRVYCCDVDRDKIEMLQEGRIPIYEPGLEEIVKDSTERGKLVFTSDLALAIRCSDILFIAVGTPMSPTGAADLQYVQSVSEFIGRHLHAPKTIVVKSTVPIGTGKRVEEWIRDNRADPSVEFDVVSNPEFLREGSAVSDFLRMERCIVGSGNAEAANRVADCFRSLDVPVHRTSRESAEMIKYAANAFLATKISFINAIANLCERLGADIEDVAEGIGSDSRIGHAFLRAGIGYGGSCFPKDTRALSWIAESSGYDFELLKAVIGTNERQKFALLDKLRAALDGTDNPTVAVLGLTFKPNTDDLREAPSLSLIPAMVAEGYKVRVYDPVALEGAKDKFGDLATYGNDAYETIEGCDACVILTEWQEFLDLDLEKVRGLLKRPILLDGRNCFSLDTIRQHGFHYYSIGRAPIAEVTAQQYV